MVKKKKLRLENLKVTSFITSEETKNVRGMLNVLTVAATNCVGNTCIFPCTDNCTETCYCPELTGTCNSCESCDNIDCPTEAPSSGDLQCLCPHSELC